MISIFPKRMKAIGTIMVLCVNLRCSEKKQNELNFNCSQT